MASKSKLAVVLIGSALLAGSLGAAKTSPVNSAAAIRGFAADGSSWPAYGGDYSEKRFSPLTQVNKGNVRQLGFAWEGDLDADRGLEAAPIVVDGVMYVSSTWSRVFAFDAVTGKRLWVYDPEVDRAITAVLCCDIVNRGVAVWNGKVFVGTLDGRLVSINARTGKRVWEVDTVADKTRPYSITGAPRVIEGKVIMGNSGADRGVRGYVTAYDAASGKQLWRFWAVPKGPGGPYENEDIAKAAKTWPNDPVWAETGGGTAWDTVTYDPELKLLYVGTGNGGSWKRQRPEDQTDNLYVASIVALNPDTGRVVWHYQEVPGDRWDFTATSPMILADLPIKGRMRKVVMQAPKGGFFYVLDRQTGELLSAEKFAPATWASHVDLKTGRPAYTENSDFTKVDRLIYPWANGFHDWQPMSFNPHTGLAYIPATDLPGIRSSRVGAPRYFYDRGVPQALLDELRKGQPDIERGAFLRAWDVANGKVKWQVKLAASWNSGTLTTASDLVFIGVSEGYLDAYDAANGARLAHIFTGNSAMSAPITYRIKGVQYIAQVSGYGGSGMLTVPEKAAVKYYQNKGRVLVFKLGGGAVPAPPRRDMPLGPPIVDNSGVPTADPQVMAQGALLYRNCSGCHSTSGATPMLPNLGRVREIGKEGFRAILLEGALAENGMPNFHGRLTETEVDALYEFVSRGEHNKPIKDPFY